MASIGNHETRQQNLRKVLQFEQYLQHQPEFFIQIYDIATIEDEVCHNGMSIFHLLKCGHIVQTDQDSQCGMNCDEPMEKNRPFMCLICKRWKMVLRHQVSRRSSRFTELILPDFPRVNESHLPKNTRSREACAVYVMSGTEMVIPRTLEDIATLRVKARIDLEQVITKVCQFGLLPPAACKEYRKTLNFLVDHQNRWIEASYEELAIVTFTRVAVRPGICTESVREALLSHYNPDMDTLWDLSVKVQELMVTMDACSAIASLTLWFERLFPRQRDRREDFGRSVLQRWLRWQKHKDISRLMLEKSCPNVIAYIIVSVMLGNDIMDASSVGRATGTRPVDWTTAARTRTWNMSPKSRKSRKIFGQGTESRRQRKVKARGAEGPEVRALGALVTGMDLNTPAEGERFGFSKLPGIGDEIVDQNVYG